MFKLNSNFLKFFSLDKIINEIISVSLLYVAFYLAETFTNVPGQEFLHDTLIVNMYWPTVILICLTGAIASFKSALPAMTALIVAVFLFLFGSEAAAFTALALAGASACLFAIRVVVNPHGLVRDDRGNA